MARGFLSGIIWGGVVSVIGAGTVSVIAEGPKAPVVDVRAPSSSNAPEVSAATTASAVTDADLVRGGETTQGASPEADTVTAATEAGSDTPTVPEAGGADDLTDPAMGADAGAVAVDDVSPVQPGAQADAPPAPAVETELSISTDPAQPAPPSVPETAGAFAPDVGQAPTPPIAEAPAPDTPDVAATPTTPSADDTRPQVETAVTDTPEPDGPEAAAPDSPAQEGDQIAALPNTEQPGTDARPRIGRPAVSLVDRTPDAPTQDADATLGASPDTALTDSRAIVVNAAPFENADDKPLMAIVLIDSGVDLTGGPIGLAALRSFPYPLTFAIDARLPDASTRMADYRAQGFEVMALLDLPQGATAGDAEVNLSAALRAVPEAVAVMEGVGTGVQENRDAADQIAQAVLATGHGLVLQSKGLNTTQKLAARTGVPAGLVFRDFDSADQTPSVIRRFLDQAAFRASQEGGVIMVGRVRADTISALLLWGLQDRAERVALAPISVVLTTLVAPQ